MSRKGNFKKGTSGNPAGRPVKSRSWKTLILEELEETLTIRENGKAKRITVAELVIKSLVKKCLSGDPASLEFLLRDTAKIDPGKEAFLLKMGRELRKDQVKD